MACQAQRWQQHLNDQEVTVAESGKENTMRIGGGVLVLILIIILLIWVL